MGSSFADNIVCSSNRAYLQGSVGNTIDMNGTQATIGGSSVPKITTQPLAASNTNEIATTQWSKTQLSGYATLNLNNTFNGVNNFTKSVEFKDVVPTPPVIVKNTVSSNSGGLLISGSGSYNGINNPGDFSIIGFGPTADTGVLTLTTWANSFCGIRIDKDTITFNAPLKCNYYNIPTIPTKTNYDIGYIWSIPGSSFTNWSSYLTPNNIYTLVWDGSGDKTLGVWRVDISIVTDTTSTSMQGGLNFNIGGPTYFNVNTRSTWTTAVGLFNSVFTQILHLSFTLDVANLTNTYYLNYYRIAGSGVTANTGASQILFTRIA